MKQKAFTLIELLVVISIIGVISSIVLVNLKDARGKASIAKILQFSHSVNNSLGAEMIGSWTFDTIQGNAVSDSSGYGNNGALKPSCPNCPQSVEGVLRKSLSFDGVDDHVQVPDTERLKFKGGKLTVSAWFKTLDTTSYNGYIVSKPWNGMGVYNYYIVWINSTGMIRWHIQGATGFDLNSSAISRETWHYVVGVVNGGKSELYIDSNLVSSQPHGIVDWNPGAFGDSNLALTIGDIYPNQPNEPPNYYLLKGLIDDVYIYSEALSIGQIKKNYAKGLEKHQLTEKSDTFEKFNSSNRL